MYRIDTATNTAMLPVPAAVGTQGYFQDTDPGGGTEVTADWLNHVQEEIAEIVEGLGGTLDKADVDQVWTYLKPRVEGIRSHATDTGVASTVENRVLVAATSCQADALQTACIASNTSTAHATRSAVIASADSYANGSSSAVIASPQASAVGAGSAAIACTDPLTGGDESAQGALSFAAASLNSKATGAQSAIVATETSQANGDNSLAAACEGSIVYGDRSVCIASFSSESGKTGDSDYGCIVAGSQASFSGSGGNGPSFVVASSYTENADPFSVALGYSAAPITHDGTNQNRHIVLDAPTGNISMIGEFNQISIDSGADKPCDTVTGPTDLTTPVLTVVNNTMVGAGSQIFVTFEDTTAPATQAAVTCTVETRVANTSFTIRSTCVAGTFSGTSVIHYWILNPNKPTEV